MLQCCFIVKCMSKHVCKVVNNCIMTCGYVQMCWVGVSVNASGPETRVGLQVILRKAG